MDLCRRVRAKFFSFVSHRSSTVRDACESLRQRNFFPWPCRLAGLLVGGTADWLAGWLILNDALLELPAAVRHDLRRTIPGASTTIFMKPDLKWAVPSLVIPPRPYMTVIIRLFDDYLFFPRAPLTSLAD